MVRPSRSVQGGGGGRRKSFDAGGGPRCFYRVGEVNDAFGVSSGLRKKRGGGGGEGAPIVTIQEKNVYVV